MQKSRENPVQACSHREVLTREVLRNSNRFQDYQKDFNQKFNWNIVTDMSSVPPASKKLYKRFFDNLTSSRDQVFGNGRLFAAQIANEDRLSFAGMLLQVGGELMKGADEVAGLFG